MSFRQRLSSCIVECMHRPRLALTLGDPAGIGPEVMAAALAENPVPECETVVIGSTAGHKAGVPTEASARAAWKALEAAAEGLRNGTFDGVVTGPVCKSTLQSVGFPFPGQTEFFADRLGAHDHAMCLTGGGLTVALVTAHVPLASVPAALEAGEICRVARLLHAHLRATGIPAPRLAVAGLNPHAGEDGHIGREEIDVIAPAVRTLAAEMQVCGPEAPDTVFHRAVGGDFDGVVCMYHDQGLIPLKLHAFDEGVNVTLGLPKPRTSPDHGTAFGIAGKGIARPQSTICALRLAARLALASDSPDRP